MILKKIEQVYIKENSLVKLKATYLILIMFILFIFSSGVFISEIFHKSPYSNIGYTLAALSSLLFILLIFRGFYNLTIMLSVVLFTIAISIGMIQGKMGEYETLFFLLLIIYVLLFSTKWAAYAVTIYCIIFFTIIFFIKRQFQEFSLLFYIVSLSSIIFMFLLSRVQMAIMENYISIITKQRDSLEDDVRQRTNELEKSQKYSNLLFSSSPCAIYSVDNNGKIVDFNNKAEEITGYTREELVGKDFNIFNKSYGSNEYKILTKEKNEKFVERYSARLYNEENDIVGEIESFIDISNWKELKEFRADIERIIRHDLKTPLNSIIGFPKLMLTDDTLSEEYKGYLMIILGAGQNMLNLINASLNMYKLEEGTFQYNMIETNVILILRQISTELREIRQRKKCKVDILINEESISVNSALTIKSEKSLIYMILTNLIKNALEASPKGHTVTVNLMHKEKLHISVHNDGSIPEEIRDTFFDKHVTARKTNGNGLGTYSAKLMAHALGANLYFETNESSGTTLNLVI